MELHERIAVIRKAMGLTQEQLGELVGVSRQAVSKWESGQTVPDALTIAKLCQKLNVSADYVLLGKEPEEMAEKPEEPAYEPPEVCPICNRPVKGTICPGCGYPVPTQPPRGPHYALVTFGGIGTVGNEEKATQLMKYCGFSKGYAETCCKQLSDYGSMTLLRRGLNDAAVQWLAAHLNRELFQLKIVEDCGESDDLLLVKPKAMELPAAERTKEPMTFGGTVLAVAVGVILALIVLSIF